MSPLESAPTSEASNVLTWNLLKFISDRSPSGLEKRGSQRLDEALRLAREHDDVIGTRDMETVSDRMMRARETKEGLELKKGPRRYIQAKEYNKSAKAALAFVKTVSDRATGNSLGRGLRPDPSINGDVLDPEDIADPGACAREICASMRPRIAPLVENMYGFNTSHAPDSISSNARRAQKLLRDMNFVYETQDDGSRRENGPYRHPIIQRAINVSWFRDKNDVGIQHHEHFDPMPERAIALTLTVIECCIDEWSDGTRRDSTWDTEKFQTVYNSYIASFSDFKIHCNTQNKDPMEMQRSLIKEARKHAGVPLLPVTNAGMFQPGKLDGPRRQGNPSSLPSYDEFRAQKGNSACERTPISTVPDYEAHRIADRLELRKIERNTSTSVPTGRDDTHRDSDLNLDKELIPYITASEAYTHALQMETPLQAAFATIGFCDEYILQVGFNEAALHESLLIEEIYLFLNGDLPTLNDEAVCEAFASFFTPFPGVLYTKESIYHLPVDPPSHGFRHLSSLGGFNIKTASPGTSSGAGAGGTPGRDRSGNDDHRGKGKSREDRPEGGGGKEGGKNEGGGDDDGGNDPDPGEPRGGGKPHKSGFYITLKSTVSIKAGDTVSHNVTTRADAVIMVNRNVEDPGWSSQKIGVNIRTVTVSCKTLAGQPAYMLSQAEVQMTGCSTKKILLAQPNPHDIHFDGDTRKKTANKTTSGNIALGIVPPHGANVTAGLTTSKGQTMEHTAGRWDISFHELTPTDRPAHLMDRTYSFVGGGYWQYIPNNEDFVIVERAIFVDSLSPSGVFRMRERVPTKVEIKVISFWETQPRSVNRWSTLFKINWGRSAAKIPAFANFICGASTVVNLNQQKVADRGTDYDILLDDLADDFKVELSEEPQHQKTVERVLDLEVPMLTAIMGRASLLDKAEHHSQGNVLL